MKLGVTFAQQEIGPSPEDISTYVAAIEEGGFDYLNIYDHVLGADTKNRPDWKGYYDLGDQFHEPFVLYGYVAAQSKLELTTGIIVSPQRQTALIAKQAAEVDVLSAGRLRLGLGIGWNTVEYGALGMDFHSRGARLEEQVTLLRLFFTQESVTFSGRFDHIDAAGILPMPRQRPIPIWLGGQGSKAALERIGRTGDGWICNTPLGSELEEALDVIHGAAATAGRERDEVGLQASVRVGEFLDEGSIREQMRAWQQVGATHLSFDAGRFGRSPQDHIALVRELSKVIGSID